MNLWDGTRQIQNLKQTYRQNSSNEHGAAKVLERRLVGADVHTISVLSPCAIVGRARLSADAECRAGPSSVGPAWSFMKLPSRRFDSDPQGKLEQEIRQIISHVSN